MNTLTLAPRDGWSGAHYSLLCADCDLLFNLFFSAYVVPSWCAAYSCSNAYVKRKLGVAFFGSEATDAVSRVSVDLACNGPLVVVWTASMYIAVQNAVYNVDYGVVFYRPL